MEDFSSFLADLLPEDLVAWPWRFVNPDDLPYLGHQQLRHLLEYWEERGGQLEYYILIEENSQNSTQCQQGRLNELYAKAAQARGKIDYLIKLLKTAETTIWLPMLRPYDWIKTGDSLKLVVVPSLTDIYPELTAAVLDAVALSDPTVNQWFQARIADGFELVLRVKDFYVLRPDELSFLQRHAMFRKIWLSSVSAWIAERKRLFNEFDGLTPESETISFENLIMRDLSIARPWHKN